MRLDGRPPHHQWNGFATVTPKYFCPAFKSSDQIRPRAGGTLCAESITRGFQTPTPKLPGVPPFSRFSRRGPATPPADTVVVLVLCSQRSNLHLRYFPLAPLLQSDPQPYFSSHPNRESHHRHAARQSATIEEHFGAVSRFARRSPTALESAPTHFQHYLMS